MIFKKASELSVDSASQLVDDYGVAVFSDFIQKSELEGLNNEYDLAFKLPQTGIEGIKMDLGKGVIFSRAHVDPQKYPHTLKTFSLKLMNDIATRYWKKSFELNKQIYFMNEVVGTSHVAMDMHFDVLPTFKFFIYLTDTTRENGAFACVPGSQKISSEIREKIGKEISFEQREITRQIPFRENEVLHVEGKAGTLIIFTTEVFHRAGKVSKGERRVMRGHNRP
jgi:hypothetical protein